MTVVCGELSWLHRHVTMMPCVLTQRAYDLLSSVSARRVENFRITERPGAMASFDRNHVIVFLAGAATAFSFMQLQTWIESRKKIAKQKQRWHFFYIVRL